MEKILVDIDDTVADTSKYLMDYAINFDKEHVNGEGIVDETMNLPRCFNWSGEDTKLFLDTVFDIHVEEIPVVPGSVEAIEKLKSLGYEIIFVSSRNEKQMKRPYERTYAWLKKSNIYFDKLLVEIKYKGPIVEEENATFFIDDSVGQTTFVADNYDTDVILFSKRNIDHNNINVIGSWNEIFNYIMNKKRLNKQ